MSFLDRLPTGQQEHIRKRMRSPEAYEALREKVKGPEDLEKELERSEQLAEAHLALESEPAVKDALKQSIENDLSEQGIEQVLEADALSDQARSALEAGTFDVGIETHPQTNEDTVVLLPEGTVNEKLPVKQTFADRYVAQLLTAKN